MMVSKANNLLVSVILPILVLLTAWMPIPTTAVRSLRIVSPLQCLTIWEHDDDDDMQVAVANSNTTSSSTSSWARKYYDTHRSRFLRRFRAGLQAEHDVRQQLVAERAAALPPSATVDAQSPSWSQQASAAVARARHAEEAALEQAFDQAFAAAAAAEEEAKTAARRKTQRKQQQQQYQIVGVVSKSPNEPAITWYARKKPANSRWSVRLVHVNRDAILKDLFDQGKIDVFAKYENTGKRNEETGLPIIQSQYLVRERSWKNLWNFSPKHFFTDSSGMYWRERRLRPGLYTDGKTVYESSYRYRDGRNGMHRVSSWTQFLGSPSFSTKTKQRAVERLQKETPDVVLEG